MRRLQFLRQRNDILDGGHSCYSHLRTCMLDDHAHAPSFCQSKSNNRQSAALLRRKTSRIDPACCYIFDVASILYNAISHHTLPCFSKTPLAPLFLHTCYTASSAAPCAPPLQGTIRIGSCALRSLF